MRPNGRMSFMYVLRVFSGQISRTALMPSTACFAGMLFVVGSHTLDPRLHALVHLPPHGGLLIGGPGNGAPPPSKSSPYAIIYSSRAETKYTSKVYDAAPLNDCLGELIRAVILLLIHYGCFAKLGPLQGFNFFTSIH